MQIHKDQHKILLRFSILILVIHWLLHHLLRHYLPQYLVMQKGLTMIIMSHLTQVKLDDRLVMSEVTVIITEHLHPHLITVYLPQNHHHLMALNHLLIITTHLTTTLIIRL